MVTGTTSDYVGTWSSTSGSVTTSTDGKTVTVDGINANSVTVTTSTAYRCTSAGYIEIHYAVSGPSISVYPVSLAMTYTQGNGPSTAKTFTLNGSNLTHDILVSLGANTDFEMSRDGTNYQTDDFELSTGDNGIVDETFYVRLASGKGVDTYESIVSIGSSDFEPKVVMLSGSVTGYTVTYNCNDETSGCPENATNVPLGYYTLASAPSKDHYTFGGWNDGTNTYNAGATYNITGNVTFTAQWTPKTHTFSTAITPANSGSVEAKNSSNETVASGSAVAETAQLTLTATPAEGYNFTSWSDGGTNTTLSSPTANPTTFTMGTSNATITATFTARTPITVTLHDGNSGTSTTTVNTYNDATLGEVVANHTIATVNGWTALGWVKSYTSGAPTLITTSEAVGSTTDLYAVYKKGSNTFSRITSTNDLSVDGVYMICYNSGTTYRFMNGVDSNNTNFMGYMASNSVSSNSFEYVAGEKFTLGGSAGAYTLKDGSNYLSATSGQQYLGLAEGGTDDVAKWTITFDNNNAKIQNNGLSGDNVYVSYYAANNKNYFNCYSNYSTIYLFKQITNDLRYSITPVADKCTVTYDVNGGDGTAPTDNNEYNVGALVTVAEGTGLSKTGYTFDGWNTKADGTGTAHAANSTFTINENTTLYAQWAIQSYAYTLNVTGADATATAVLKVDNENVGANAQIQYNKEVTVVVALSDVAAYVYNVSVVKTGTTDAVTVSNNKFTSIIGSVI